jgi:hypothetical protein
MSRPLLWSLCVLAALMGSPVAAQVASSANSPESTSGADEDNLALSSAMRAIDRQDYPEALKQLRPLARKGNAVAQHNIGVMFASGRGVARDYDAAQALFRMATAQGYAPSMWSLGLMFAQGEGVQPNLIESYKWFILARLVLDQDDVSNPDAHLREDISQGLRKLADILTREQVKQAEDLATAWNPNAVRAEAKLLQKMESVKDYNGTCQSFRGIKQGVRSIDHLLRSEAAEGRSNLLSCLAFIEHARLTKDCDAREPRLDEVLFYLRLLGSKQKDAARLPAEAAVATALVIGGYCKANQPPTPAAEATFAKLRKAFSAEVSQKTNTR